MKRSLLGSFGLACACAVLAAFGSGGSAVLGFEPGQPYPSDASQSKDSATSDRADARDGRADDGGLSGDAPRPPDDAYPDGSDPGDAAVICKGGDLRCSATGVPQK